VFSKLNRREVTNRSRASLAGTEARLNNRIPFYGTMITRNRDMLHVKQLNPVRRRTCFQREQSSEATARAQPLAQIIAINVAERTSQFLSSDLSEIVILARRMIR
jgi:hypothetical protein